MHGVMVHGKERERERMCVSVIELAIWVNELGSSCFESWSTYNILTSDF